MSYLFFATLKIDYKIVDKENPIIDHRYIKEQLMIISSEY